MRVIFLRHGQSEGNLVGEIQGQKDYPLSLKGIEQAHKKGKEMTKTYCIDKIYSSDLLRAKKTAEIVGSYFNIREITLDDRLREFHFGSFQGRKSIELTKEENALISSCWNSTNRRLPGGETVEELSTRVTKAFTEIINSNPQDSTVLIASHRRALYTILKQILGTVPIVTDEWFKNCSINELVRDNLTDDWLLVRFDSEYL